jgi:hypothetical protein
VFCLPQVSIAFPSKIKGFSARSNSTIAHPDQKGAESEKEFFSSFSRAPTFNPAPEYGRFLTILSSVGQIWRIFPQFAAYFLRDFFIVNVFMEGRKNFEMQRTGLFGHIFPFMSVDQIMT